MPDENSHSLIASELRLKAEEQLKMRKAKKLANLSEGDMLKLLHELEVHQLELEIQNEAYQHAKESAEITARQYTDHFEEVYDFSPAGYFMLGSGGEIFKLNLTGAKLIGYERQTCLTVISSSLSLWRP